LLDPELVTIFVREWHEARARRSADASGRRRDLERTLRAATAKVDRLLKAVIDGGSEFAEIRDALDSARAQKAQLEEEIGATDAGGVIALHPGIADDYRRQIADLRTALAEADEDNRRAAAAQLRALIDRIIILPHPTEAGVAIQVEGRLAALLSLAAGPAATNLCVNAGAG
jgi:hypothetical protein